MGLVDARQGSGMYVARPDFEPLQFDPLTSASKEAVLQIVEVRRALEAEVHDLQLALETRKVVDRAKGILMDTQGLSEAAAFRKIQKLSMNTRKPMKEVAEAIILARQLEVEEND